MLRFILRLLLCMFLFLGGAYANAQPIKKKPITVIRIDSSKIKPAKFNRDVIRNYANEKEFKYDEAINRELSWWDRFWMWFWKAIGQLFKGAASNPFSKYFFIFLGIALVVFIVIKIIGADNIFSKKSKEIILPYDVLNENIHEIDYEAELQRLIKEGKYRLSIRLLYLRALKKLSDAEIIHWQPDKTNYNYLMEISKPQLKTDFSVLTHQFDYIWYGDFPIDQSKFETIYQSFNQFNAQIK